MTLQVTTQIIWVALKKNYQAALEKKDSFDFVGTYSQFRSFLKKVSENNPNITLHKGVIITDIATNSTRLDREPQFFDVDFSRDTLKVILKQTSNNILSSSNALELYTLETLSNPRDYYKEVLSTYKRVTFFDHFNTFKYVISKDLRASLEEIVYKYFSSLIDLEEFRKGFDSVEFQLKPNHKDKFIPVKSFISSERAEVLLRLVTETNQEVIRNSLDEYSLDYFDVNYLKAYLRDFGLTKEEKSKRKERVLDLKFDNQVND